MKRTIAVLFAIISVGSIHGQQLGTPTPLQRILNELPAIPIAGRSLKFEFGGTGWVAKVNGENALAGTVETVDISGGSILTLKQTHVWGGAAGRAASGLLGGALGGAIGSAANMWIATPGPEIVLDYKSGPRASLSLASEARIAETRAAGGHTTGTVTAGTPPPLPGAAAVVPQAAVAATPQSNLSAAEAALAAAKASVEARAAERRLAEALAAAEAKAAETREAERLAVAARSAPNASESNIRLADARAAEARAAETLAIAEARMAEVRAAEALEAERRSTGVSAVAEGVPPPLPNASGPPSLPASLIQTSAVTDSWKIGINIDLSGFFLYGPSLTMELTKNNWNNQINIRFPSLGILYNYDGFAFGFGYGLNYLWPNKIGAFYLGGLADISFLPTFPGHHPPCAEFIFAVNTGFKFILSSGIYFNVGGYFGLLQIDDIETKFTIRPVLALGYSF